MTGLLRPQNTGSVLGRQLRAVLCRGMTLPLPLEQLFCWIEVHGYFVDNANGRMGCLGSPSRTAQNDGTRIAFAAKGNADLKHWFGTSDPAVVERLCVFARTGMDGSMAAFWLDDTGGQKIVHLGSGSGSVTVCTLAEDPVDFLRLLAIGYDEICWGDEYTAPPTREDNQQRQPNSHFAEWVAQTFSVSIPACGAEIVPKAASMTDITSDDPFWRWVQRNKAH